MSRATTPGALIAAVAGSDPERALLAAIVRVACEDAARGDAGARRWLQSPACLALLAWIAPDEVDPASVQARLVARLPPARDGPV